MFLEIASKLLAESLLSLYPTFVKNINLSLGIQLWSRCFSYILISAFFIDWSFISVHLFSQNGLLLSFITAVHIYTSYRGFQLLEGGIAYALFYTYPLMILLLSGEKIQFMTLFALLGVIIIYFNDSIDKIILDKFINTRLPVTTDKTGALQNQPTGSSISHNADNSLTGYLMIFFAALTEALIYFLVREIKTSNNWNHLFLSYLFGGIATTGYYFQDISKIINSSSNVLTLSLIINIFIGLCGYLLRFFAISRLKPAIYAPLSYFGIIMAFIYGISFNNETVSITKLFGVFCILLGTYNTIIHI